MKLLSCTFFLLSFLTINSVANAQHHGSVGGGYHHYSVPQHHGYSAPRNYGYRTGYGYNPYYGLGLVNPLYFGNLGYAPYGGYPSYLNLPLGGNALPTCPYPYGSQQYRWCFFRQYGYYPY